MLVSVNIASVLTFTFLIQMTYATSELRFQCRNTEIGHVPWN